jgi:outer membrane protein insertion porin family
VSPYGRSFRKPSWKRRVLLALTVSVAAVCLLVVLALIAIHTPPARRLVASRMADLLERQHVAINAQQFRYNLLDASVTLQQVDLRSTTWRDGPPFITIGRAHFDVSLRELLRGRYVLESGTLDQVAVHYLVDEQGRTNVPRRPPGSGSDDARASSFDYLISWLSINTARVRFEDRPRRVDAQLSIHAVVVNGNPLTGGHTIRLDGGGGNLRLADDQVAIDRVRADGVLGRDDLAIDRISIDAGGSQMEMQGMVTGFAAPVVNAHVSASALRFRDLRDMDVDTTLSFDVPAQVADISALQIRAPWGGLSARGRIAFSESGQSNARADLTRLDAGVLMQALRLPVVAASEVTGTAEATWPGLDYLQAKGALEATLRKATPIERPRAVPVSGRVVARADGGRIVARLVKVETPGAQADGRIELTADRQVQGRLTGRAADVQALIALAEAMGGRPRGSLSYPVHGSIAIDARVDGPLDAPVAHAVVNAPSLALDQTDVGSLTAVASYAKRTLTISKGELNWNQARARFEGRVGTAPDEPLDLVLSADEVNVETLLSAFNLADLPIAGDITAHGTVRGTLGHPLVRIDASGSNLVACNELMGSLTATLHMDGRQLTVSELLVDKPQPEQHGRLSATGTYDLDRRTYTFDVQSQSLKLLGLVMPDGRQVRANLPRLAARGAGTLDSPEASLDLEVDAIEIDPPGQTVDAEGDVSDTTRLGRVVLNGVANDGTATIIATAEQFALDARADIGLQMPWPTTLTMRASDLDLATLPLPEWLTARVETSAGLQGRIRATLDASGTLERPAAGRASLAIESFAGAWNGRPFAMTSPWAIHYAGERLTIDSLAIQAADTSLTISGGLPVADRTQPGEIAVDVQGTLATLTQYFPADADISGDGSLRLTGLVGGTLHALEPDLTLTVENGLLLSPSLHPGFSNIGLRARLTNGAAEIDQFDAHWGTATLQASGRVPLDVLPELPVQIARDSRPPTFESRRAALKIVLTGLNPSALPGVPAQIGGRISAVADLTTTTAGIDTLDGLISFEEMGLTFAGLTLAQQQPARITIASGTANVEPLQLSGSAGTITAGGRVGVAGARRLDLDIDGALDIAALSVLTGQVRMQGESTVKVGIRGTLTQPDVRGTVSLTDATLVRDEPRMAAENINAHFELDGSRLLLTRFDADLNGGTVNASGTVTLGERVVDDVDLEINAEEVAYDEPLGLRSLSNARLRVTRSGETIVVKGKVSIQEAGLTDDVILDAGLLARIAARRDGDLTRVRNPLLQRVRFDIDVSTATPVLVDNNLARAELDAELHVVGTADEPALLGTLTLREGSEIVLNERRYHAERGIITFTDERRILPTFDLRLNATVNDYDVTLVVSGPLNNTETTLTSVPSLPEPDILAMLMTGRTVEQVRGEELEVAREQVFSTLAGRVGSTLGRRLQHATGFTEVRIEPTLIANEADPSARLTLGQTLTNNLKIVFSSNLADSNDQIWIVEYDVTRRFQARAVWQDDGSHRVDFRRDMRFGEDEDVRADTRVRSHVSAVSVTTDGADESTVRDRFRIKAGDTYDFFEIRNGIRRVEESLVAQGYLQSRVRLERQSDGDRTYLQLHVTAGPQVELVFKGADPPRRVERAVREQWHKGVFDAQRFDDAAEVLGEWLLDDRYLQATVAYEIDDIADGRRQAVFEIQPGERSSRVVMVFEGASAISPGRLDRVIAEQALERSLFTDPEVVADVLRRYYRAHGYLSAEVDEPRVEFDDHTARAVVPIREGPAFKVGSITVTGNTVVDSSALIGSLPLAAGHPLVPSAAENALSTIRNQYWNRGYNEVRADYELTVHGGAGEVDVAFTVVEGRQSVIAGIAIDGNERVSTRLVRDQIDVSAEDPLDLNAVAQWRRRLYETGAFSAVDITRREVDQPRSDGPKQVLLDVDLREAPPFHLRYGASYDTERSIGVILDATNRNSLGRARELGIRSRYDGQIRDVRLYVNQPALAHSVETTLSLYYREELNPPTELSDPFDISRKGASIQQHRRLLNNYVWTYGYKYERALTSTPTPAGIIDEDVTVSPLTSTITRETRDVAFDASKGAFSSQALSFSPRWLGSKQPFVKYFGQYFHYFPLQDERQNPFTGEVIRPRLVFASGVRLGLAWGLGSPVPRTERFFAGGSATLRGFEQNTVGPITPERFALGGEALLVLNNELRMPLIGSLDGVLFTDIGNVFPRVRDVSLGDLRQSAGFGLRLRTAWLLLRGDYGVVLDPRPGEERGQFYISVGQAF